MRRYEAMEQIMKVVTDELVVCNIGHPSQELYKIQDRPKNFYMLGSMGLASSIGLGLALTTTQTVVVLEGDGAVLMNLSTLTTIAVNKPKNYVLVIIDNESYGSTGFQPTFTSQGIDLCRIAGACPSIQTEFIIDKNDIQPVLKKVLNEKKGPYCVVIKTKSGMPEGVGIIPIKGIDIRDRFMKEIEVGGV